MLFGKKVAENIFTIHKLLALTKLTNICVIYRKCVKIHINQYLKNLMRDRFIISNKIFSIKYNK